jgi:hypothetical protein
VKEYIQNILRVITFLRKNHDHYQVTKILYKLHKNLNN